VDSLRDWFTTFGLVVTKPLPQTYVKEAARAKGKFSSAVAWLVFYAIAMILSAAIATRAFSVIVLLIAVLLYPIVVLLFIFFTRLLCMRLFSRKKDYYDELLYLTVANLVPFIVLGFLSAPFPKLVGPFFWIGLLYSLILTVIALKALTNLRYWQSAVTVLLAGVLASAGFFCVGFTIFGLMRAVPGVLSGGF
jgi:hypothetical protein